MNIGVLIFLLAIIDFIIHRICVHFEFKSNERLFFIIYYDLLKGDIAKEIKNCTKLLLKTRKFTKENNTNGIIDKKDNIEILFL